MIDPRRTDVVKQQETSYIKTAGLVAALAYTGYRFSSNMTTMIRDSLHMLQLSVETTARYMPQFTGVDDDGFETTYDDIYDISSQEITNPLQSTLRADEMYHADTTLDLDYSPDTMFDDFIETDVGDGVSQAEINTVLETPFSAGEKMAGTTSGIRALEKDYSGIMAVMNEHGMSIDRVMMTNEGYMLTLLHEGAKEHVTLPYYRNGFVSLRGAKYRPLIGLTFSAKDFSDKIVFGHDYGYQVMHGLREELSSAFRMSGDKKPVSRVADKIRSLTRRYAGEYVGNINALGIIGQRKFKLLSLTKEQENIFSSRADSAFQYFLEQAHGAHVMLKESDGSWTKTPWTIDMPMASEQAILKGTISTGGPLPGYLNAPQGKQSQLRADFMRGHILKHRMTPQYVASRLGLIADSVATNLSQGMYETIPGRTANVTFYFGDISHAGKGSAVFLARRGRSGVNINDFRATVPNRYPVKLFQKDGKTFTHPSTHELYRKLDAARIFASPVKIQKGEVLGVDPVSGELLTARSDGYITHHTIEGGILDIHVAEDRFLTEGDKLTPNKAVVGRVLTVDELANQFRGRGDLGKAVAEYITMGDADTGTELFLNWDMRSKYKGGGMGIGMLQRVMNDIAVLKRKELEQEFHQQHGTGVLRIDDISHEKMKSVTTDMRNIIRTAFGDEIANSVKDITFTPSFDVAITLHNDMHTGSQSFTRLLDIDTAFEHGAMGDWRALEQISDRIDKAITTHMPRVKYRLSATAEQLLAGLQNDNIPSLIWYGKDGSRSLMSATIRPFVGMHAASAPQYRSFAGASKTLLGFSGGFKNTWDHKKNAQNMGLPHYVQYLNHLQDYHLSYIQDKYKTAEMHVLGNSHFSRSGENYISLDGNKRVVSLGQLAKNGLMETMAANYHDESVRSAFVKFRKTIANTASLPGKIDSKRIAELAQSGLFTLDDLAQTGFFGLRGNTIDMVDAASMQELMKLVNTAKSKETVYLELPMEVSVDGIQGKFVPLMNFDSSDMFELMKRVDKTGVSGSVTEFMPHYTGSAFWQEQISFMNKTMNIANYMRTHSLSDHETKAMQGSLETAVYDFRNNVRKLFSGKKSPARTRVHEHRLPFSTYGMMRSSSEIPLDTVGMHVDDIVKLVTGNRVTSADRAEKIAAQFDEMQYIASRSKKILDILPDADGMTPVSSAQQQAIVNLMDDIDTVGSKRTQTKVLLKHMKTMIDAKNVFGDRYYNNKLLKRVRDHAGSAIQIFDTRKDEMLLHKYAHETLQRIEQGSVVITGRLQGSPELSEFSGRHVQLMALRDQGKVSKRVTDMIRKTADGKKTAMLMESMADGHMLTNEATALAAARDYDGDSMGFIITSLDELDTISREIGMERGILSTMGIKTDQVKNMSQEAIEKMIRAVTVIEENVEGDRLIRPANMSAVTLAHELQSAKYKGRVETEEAFAGIMRMYRRLYPNMSDRLLRQKTKVLYDTLEKENLHAHATDRTMRMVTGIRELGTVEEEMQRLYPAGDIAKRFPDILPEYLRQKMSNEELAIYKRVVESGKDDMAVFNADIDLQNRSRLVEMKRSTPSAYRTRGALLNLSETYARNEQERTFLSLWADKVIAQNTISIKHGTPSILGDIMKKIDIMSNTGTVVPEQLIDDIVTGNYVVTPHENEIKEMKRLGLLGNKTEIHMEEYGQYLDIKKEYLNELDTAHTLAGESLLQDMQHAKDTDILQRQYRSRIDTHMANYKMMGGKNAGKTFAEIFGNIKTKVLGPYEYHHDIVKRAVDIANEAKKNYDKFRIEGNIKTVFGNDIIDSTSTAFKNLKSTVKSVAGHLKLYAEVHGHAPAADPLELEFNRSSSASLTENIYNLITEHGDRIREYRTRETHAKYTFRSENMLEREFLRVSRHVHNMHNVRVSKNQHDVRTAAFYELKNKERRFLKKDVAARIPGESSLLRQGSLLDGLTGKIHSLMKSSAEDLHLKRIGRMKGMSMLGGLFIGAVAGQAFNQMHAGYAVPGLQDTRGLGGEYYENKSGIMGGEVEALLAPQPPRIVSWEGKDAQQYQKLARESRITEALSYNSKEISPLPYQIRGVMVR